MSLRRALLAMAVLAVLVPRGTAALADSTIITTQPVQGHPYNAAPIRDNFGRAAADINSIERMNAGASAPSSPSTGTLWLQTPGSGTTLTLKVWIGSASAWVPIARIDSATGVWEPPVGGGALPNLVSASTTDIGAAAQAALTITGAQTIASFGASAPPGVVKFLIFTGSPTLVQNATFLKLPGATNLTVAPGDTMIALSLGTGRWQVFGTVNNLPPGTGTVTSVTFTGDGTVLSSTPSAAVTTSGTLTAALKTQVANTVLAGPTTGADALPTFRSLVPADLPVATSIAFGIVEPDNSTITISGGVISSVSGAAGISQLTGDVLAGPGVGSVAATLANIVAPGTALQITYNAKGQVTAGATAACADLSDDGEGCSATARAANLVLAGPTTGGAVAPTFRAMVSADLPAISCTDLSNDGTACQANTGTSGHTLPFLDTANNWDAPQRGKQGTVAISTATFTPNLDTNQHFSITLVNAACPCTIANPTNIASAPGQVGMLKIIQSATGSDTIGTWGGQWKFASGTPPTLTTTANAIDQFSYYVDDSTHIVLSPGMLDVK